MSRRGRAGRAGHWERVVAGWRTSGLSRAEFCRRHELNYQTMASWVRRLGRSRGKPGGNKAPAVGTVRGGQASFVEVSLPAAGIDSTRYEILLGHDRSIRFGADFNDDVLTRLIRAVESC